MPRRGNRHLLFRFYATVLFLHSFFTSFVHWFPFNFSLFPPCSIPLVIKAYDIDSGLNSHLHYDIVETMPRRYFHIDSTTGAIKTVMLLDHEKIPLFTFHVKVRTKNKPSSGQAGRQYQPKMYEKHTRQPHYSKNFVEECLWFLLRSFFIKNI